MFRRSTVLLAGAAAVLWASASAAASGPTVAQISAAVAYRIAHSHDYVLATSGRTRHALPSGSWRTWIDLETGASRSIGQSQTGKRATLQVVTPEPRDPAVANVSDTSVDYRTRTWTETTREAPLKAIRPVVIDPLATTQAGLRFTLLGVESVDGRQAYHLRSTYFARSPAQAERWDVWISTDQDFLIRDTRTTNDGLVFWSSDLRWLPRTAANLALLRMAIPTGFRQEFVSS